MLLASVPTKWSSSLTSRTLKPQLASPPPSMPPLSHPSVDAHQEVQCIIGENLPMHPGSFSISLASNVPTNYDLLAYMGWPPTAINMPGGRASIRTSICNNKYYTIMLHLAPDNIYCILLHYTTVKQVINASLSLTAQSFYYLD